MKETGWFCSRCGHFNTRTVICVQCGERFREPKVVPELAGGKGLLSPKNRRISESEIACILNTITNPPNLRKHPQKGDMKGRFLAWFDGGAIRVDTGVKTYFLDDKTVVEVQSPINWISIEIEFPDGESVVIKQLKKREMRPG